MVDRPSFDTPCEPEVLPTRPRLRRRIPIDRPAIGASTFSQPESELDAKRLKLFEAVLNSHASVVTSFVQPLGRPVTLRVADADLPSLAEDITVALEDGQVVYRWSWRRAIAGVDLEEQAAAVVAVLQVKAGFTA